jgi:hypothetical protein
MSGKKLDELIADVSSHFKNPSEIVRAADLSHAEKVKLLTQWDYDLQLMLTATDENMPGSDTAAEKVRQVHKALAELGEGPDVQAPQSSTVGGAGTA